MLREKFIVGDSVIVTCKNKILKGLHCICEGEKFILSNFYLKDICFSNKNGLYEATGFYLKTDRFTGKKFEWYFTRHNPFLLEKVHQNQRIITFDIVDKDRDGLVYDIVTNHVNPKEDGDVHRYRIIDSIEFEIIERERLDWV